LNEILKMKLFVNKESVELNPFVMEYLARISIGIVSSLKGVDYIRTIEIHDEHNDVKIKVNGEEVSLTPFPVKVISSTLHGVVSTLKGIGDIVSLHIDVEAK